MVGDLSFRNPLEHGLVSPELPGSEAAAVNAAAGSVDVAAFGKMVALLGLGGWLLESGLTAAIVRFVYRVRPDLVVRSAARGSGVSSEMPVRRSG